MKTDARCLRMLIVLMFLFVALRLFALDKPCASTIFNDDPAYTVSGHVKYSYRTPETWTFIHFSDDREVCFTEELSPDAVKSGQDVTYTYRRHCSKSCYTFVKSEAKK